MFGCSIADELMQHIVTRVTDEGLVIELFETETAPLFTGAATPTPLLEDLAVVLARASEIVTNAMAIEGHTAAFPLVLAEDPSWNVSALRASVFRELLTGDGLDRNRVQRLTSHGDREPSHANPMNVRNNRIEVVFLRDI